MKKILLAGVPYHGNIGDSAIFCAEKKFIEDNFKDYRLYNISEEATKRCIMKIKRYFCDKDVIFFHGGGNIGNVYKWHEEGRRNVIENFKNNRIILFPQTIYFEDNEDGERQLEITKEIYNSHKNLTLIAREEKSYNIMKKYFPNNKVILTPDMVTYLDMTEPKQNRNGALFVMRNDKEIKIDKTDVEIVQNILKKYYNNVTYSDTHLRYDKAEAYDKRIETLENKLNEFRKAKIVITDRLHGMIFSAITSTPCIAFGNFNHKVESSAKWFENLGYVKYVNDIEQVEKYVKELKSLNNIQYNNEFAKEYFKQIVDIVNNEG